MQNQSKSTKKYAVLHINLHTRGKPFKERGNNHIISINKFRRKKIGEKFYARTNAPYICVPWGVGWLW